MLARYIQRRERRATSLHTQPSDVVAIIDQMDERRRGERQAIDAAIDAGPSVLPNITKALGRYSQSKREVALWTLAYLGGDRAIEALRHECMIRPGPGVAAALCTALASRGNEEDRSLLVEMLEARPSDRSIGEWQSVTSAALSLGVLRVAGAIPVLEKTVREAPGIPGEAARFAVRWIRDGPFAVDVTNLSSAEASVLAAVIENGVPRSEEASESCDVDRHGAWIREGRRWSFRPGLPTLRLPAIGFWIHRSPDSLRAIVSAALYFGPANGVGYDYVMRNDETWRVKALVFKWIS